MGAKYCDRFVCDSVCVSVSLSVCPRAYISGTAGPIFTKFVVQIPCGRGSALSRGIANLRYVMYFRFYA